MAGWNLSELAVRNRSVTLFLIVAVLAGGRARVPAARPRRRPVLHRESDDGDRGLARRHRGGDAGAGRRSAREAPAGARLLRPRRDDLAAGLRVDARSRSATTTPPSLVPELFYQARKKLSDEAASLPQRRATARSSTTSTPTCTSRSTRSTPGRCRTASRCCWPSDLRQRLLRVPGVKKVNILGEQEPEDLRRVLLRAPGHAGRHAGADVRGARHPEQRRALGLRRDRRSARLRTRRRRVRHARADRGRARRRERPHPAHRGRRHGDARLRGPAELPHSPPGSARADARRDHGAALERARAGRGARAARRRASTPGCRSASASRRSPTRPARSARPSASSC